MILELNSIPIEITLKPIKRLNLRIYPPDGRVKVSAPLHFKTSLIVQFLEEKMDWIEAQRLRLQKKVPVVEPLKSASQIEFKGRFYTLMLKEHLGPRHVTIQENTIYCYTKPNCSEPELQALLDQWLKNEMQALLPSLIQKWQTLIGVNLRQWGIKKMKTRWGSCNTRAARIWLNLSLIQKPPICLEYVLVHELVHLLEPSHNKRFHALMTYYMPQWKTYKQLLEGRLRLKELDCA